MTELNGSDIGAVPFSSELWRSENYLFFDTASAAIVQDFVNALNLKKILICEDSILWRVECISRLRRSAEK